MGTVLHVPRWLTLLGVFGACPELVDEDNGKNMYDYESLVLTTQYSKALGIARMVVRSNLAPHRVFLPEGYRVLQNWAVSTVDNIYDGYSSLISLKEHP